jgi:hypothetical protein
VELKRPWWQVTTSLRIALIISSGWLLAGLGGVADGLVGGRIWFAVIEGLYCLCGTPWYVTAILLLGQSHRAGSEKVRI